MSSVRGSSP
ncbi:Protein of unknown function [Propionibacterium freudenreichii]|nr:Protein of unknown function [Propionibacterium freudenreichii]